MGDQMFNYFGRTNVQLFFSYGIKKNKYRDHFAPDPGPVGTTSALSSSLH